MEKQIKLFYDLDQARQILNNFTAEELADCRRITIGLLDEYKDSMSFSMFQQKYPNWESIVANPETKEGTVLVIVHWHEKHVPRVCAAVEHKVGLGFKTLYVDGTIRFVKYSEIIDVRPTTVQMKNVAKLVVKNGRDSAVVELAFLDSCLPTLQELEKNLQEAARNKLALEQAQTSF